MKILFFVRKFNDATHTFIYNELVGLHSRGHNIKVVCVQRINENRYPFSNVEVAPISIWQRFLSNRMAQLGIRMNYYNMPLARFLDKTIKDFQPDIVHCHFGPDGLYFLDNFKPESVNKIPVFIHFHGFDASILLKNRLYCSRLRGLFKRSDVFPIFVSEFMREGVQKAVGYTGSNFILYYGTNTDFFSPAPAFPARGDDAIVFLQVASLREKKGHVYTFRALARWSGQTPNRKWKFVVTGSGEELAMLEQEAVTLGIRAHIEFVGFVDAETTRELLQNAHIFLHHSVTGSKDGDMEGIPNTLMEAMAMELPIVSTFHAGIPELVEDGVNGYLVSERDVEHYAQCIAKIVAWPRQPQNREKVNAMFEQKQHAATLESFYQRAIQQLDK